MDRKRAPKQRRVPRWDTAKGSNIPPQTQATKRQMATICLSMIVKNEAHCIKRCLDSVRPYIASWVICDTGSTDGTQDIIQAVMAETPGVLREDAWVDFAHNRNLALHAAQRMGCAYVLTLDADEMLVVDSPQVFDGLAGECYFINLQHHVASQQRLGLLRADLPWRWEGVIHERVESGTEYTPVLLSGVHYEHRSDGARSQDAEKHVNDARVLEQAVKDEPQNPYYWFSLAGEYQQLGRIAEALPAYRRYIDLAPAISHVHWWVLCQIGICALTQNDFTGAASAFFASYAMNPDQAEPLFHLGRAYLLRREFILALPLLELAASKPQPTVSVVLNHAIYTHRARQHHILCSYYLTRYVTGTDKLPPAAKERLTRLLAPSALHPKDREAFERAGLLPLQI